MAVPGSDGGITAVLTILSSTRSTKQTWAIRIGTGFAFLIKSFLVSAIVIAAVQGIWVTLRRKSVKLRGIDGMFAVLTSPITFLIPDLWVYAKTLTLLAVISWFVRCFLLKRAIIYCPTRLVPLTAVITPATLSVRLLPTTNITQRRVATVNFTDSFWLPWVSLEGAGFIQSPTPDISRLFTATSSSVEVLPIPAPFPNSSYTLEFWGPSYKCQSLSQAVVEMQGKTFTDYMGN